MHEWQKWQKVLVWVLVVFIIVAGSIATYRFATRETSPLPRDIRFALTFSPFVLPDGTKKYTTSDYKFSTAEDNVQILSYVIHTDEAIAISVSEYTQPQQFTDIPEYKDRFLTNVAKQYDTVQTSNGVIYLGRMTLQNNKQLGVMLEKGLIVFLSPDKELDKAHWRNLGDQLELQKVIN